MSLSDYAVSIIPGLKRAQVADDLRNLLVEYEERTIPPYGVAAGLFDRVPFNHPETQEFDRTYQRQLRLDSNLLGNYVFSVHQVLQRAVLNLKVLQDLTDKYVGGVIVKDGMTYSRANFLRLVELSGFLANYARKLLLWTLHQEEVKIGQRLPSPLVPSELEWMQLHRESFFLCLELFGKKPERFRGALMNIPHIVIDTDSDAQNNAVLGRQNLDMTSSHLIPIKLNPVYHIGMAIAEYQAHRYKVVQEEARALEYRLLALSELREGKTDPKLEQQIEYTESRLKKLKYKLHQMEGDE